MRRRWQNNEGVKRNDRGDSASPEATRQTNSHKQRQTNAQWLKLNIIGTYKVYI